MNPLRGGRYSPRRRAQPTVLETKRRRRPRAPSGVGRTRIGG